MCFLLRSLDYDFYVHLIVNTFTMEFHHPLRSRNLNNPFRRCVVNCPTTNPDCPPCAENEECVLIGQSCDSCARTICVAPPNQDDDDSGGGTNTGAIAGGVIGGVVLVAIICLALWFYNRKRKSMVVEETNPNGFEKRDNFYGTERVGRSRVGSMASTVMTRASNVIQIAYIPGVTNRSPPDTPGLVPPVPPIPAAGSPHGSDQHYFLPGDIRDSVWSEMSEDQRKSISPSLARSSVATTIYRNNAIVSPIPAQQAMRAKAAMVSVKSGSSTPGSLTPGSAGSAAPAVPAITTAQLHKAQQNTLGVSSIVARSGVARPVNVGKPRSKPDTISEEGDKSIPTVTVEDASGSAEESNSNGNRRQSSQSNAVTEIDDSPAVRQSPFADPQSPIEKSSKPTGTSSAIPEEMSSQEGGDSRRASTHRKRNSQSSAQLLQEADPSKRSASPFGDENEVK